MRTSGEMSLLTDHVIEFVTRNQDSVKARNDSTRERRLSDLAAVKAHEQATINALAETRANTATSIAASIDDAVDPVHARTIVDIDKQIAAATARIVTCEQVTADRTAGSLVFVSNKQNLKSCRQQYVLIRPFNFFTLMYDCYT